MLTKHNINVVIVCLIACRLAHVLAGSLGLEWYLLREQRHVQSDIEAECARIATLACLIKNLERGTQSDG